jgi:hypothetical protein
LSRRRFQQGQQVGAGVALAAFGLGKVAAELALQHAVHALDLLFFAQLHAEVRSAAATGAAVLAGLAVELGLIADRAAGALQEKVGAFTAGKFGLGAEITCHLRILFDWLTRQMPCMGTPRESGGEKAARTDGGLGGWASERPAPSGKWPARTKVHAGPGNL